MNDANNAMIEELQRLDQQLVEASAEFRLARVRYDLASEKYQAVRNLITERLNLDPYIQLVNDELYVFASGGRYRLLGLSAGEAALAILKEAEGEALSLDEIANRMRLTGAGFLPRMINAALLQMKNIDKPEEGKYRYVEPKEEESD